ncbi:MAG: hypothetical protein ACK42D_03755 [Candidatus Paceibacteria bacterium]
MFMMSKGRDNSQDKLFALGREEREIYDKIRRLREVKARDIARVEQRYDSDILRNEQAIMRLRREIEQIEREIARNK